ncbi:MAG: hypothetical protein AAFR52_16755, partial [Pseudomonadota bacterium]
MPFRIARLAVWDDTALPATARVAVTHAGPHGIEARLDIADAAGRRIACLDGLSLAPLPVAVAAEGPAFWQTRWVPVAMDATAAGATATAQPRLAPDRLAATLRATGLVAEALPPPGEALLVIDALLRRAVWDRVEALAGPGGTIDPALVAPEARPLLETLVAILAEDGGVATDDTGATALATEAPHPDRDSLLALLAEVAPGHGDEVARLMAVGDVIEARLRPAGDDAPGHADTLAPTLATANRRHAALWAAMAGLGATAIATCPAESALSVLVLGRPTAPALATLAAAAGGRRVLVAETGAPASGRALPAPANLVHAAPDRAAGMGPFDLVLFDDGLRDLAPATLREIAGALVEGGLAAGVEAAGGLAEALHGRLAAPGTIDPAALGQGIGAVARKAGLDLAETLALADPEALGQIVLARPRPAGAAAAVAEPAGPAPATLILHGAGCEARAGALAEALARTGAAVDFAPMGSSETPDTGLPADL